MWKSLLISLLLLTASGCVGRAVKLPPEYRRAALLSSEESQRLIMSMKAQGDQIRSFRAFAKVTVEKFPGSQSVYQSILFSRNVGLRIELFEPTLHRLLGLVVVKGEELSALDAEKKEVLLGRATAENLERVVALPFTPEQAMLIFAGQAIFPEEESQETGEIELKRHPEKSEYLLTKRLSKGREFRAILFLTPSNKWELLQLSLSEMRSERLILQATFGEYTPGPESYPQRIEVNLPQRQITSKLVYQSVAINKSSIDPAKFELRIPARYQVRELGQD